MFKSIKSISIDQKKNLAKATVRNQRSQCRTTHKRKDC